LRDNGYAFNKRLKQYIHETINTGNNETINNVSRETLNTGNNKTIKTVKCTFDLPEQLHREMKAKCALEGLKMVDFVREVLEKSIKK
jgi:predicted DNA binding CopG/RHH family protein